MEFAIKDLGPLHYLLGIKVIPYDGGVFLSQAKYATELLTKTKMLHANHVNTPLVVNHNLHLNQTSTVDGNSYRNVVGALQYLTLARPDITHAVNLVCQFMAAPNASHYKAIKRMLRYLKGIIDYGLRIVAQSSINLYGFSYADWVGCPLTRRFTNDYWGKLHLLGSQDTTYSGEIQH